MFEFIEKFEHWLAALAGSLIALIFLQPPVLQLIGYIAGGLLTSYYISPLIAEWLDAPLPSTGFIVGLFSMAIIAKIFVIVEALDPKEVVQKLLKKIGLS